MTHMDTASTSADVVRGFYEAMQARWTSFGADEPLPGRSQYVERY
jgi:hypothetical protein